jgi:outer membrane protein insertion porin family
VFLIPSKSIKKHIYIFKGIITLLMMFCFSFSFSQNTGGIKQIGTSADVNYANPTEFSLASFDVKGLKSLDKNVIKLMSGLYEGQKLKIPGDATADAIKKLWKTGFFDNVQLYLEKTVGNEAWLYFEVVEKPRLSKFS